MLFCLVNKNVFVYLSCYEKASLVILYNKTAFTTLGFFSLASVNYNYLYLKL